MKNWFVSYGLLIPAMICWNMVLGQNPGGLSTSSKMWLKANMGTSTNVSGAPVSSWQDQTVLGALLAQPTTSKQPIFTQSYTNYNPAVHFDGNDDVMGVNLGADQYTTAFTFFMVTSLLSTNNQGALFHNHSTPSGNGDLTSFQLDANGTTYRYRNATNTSGQDGMQIAAYNSNARLFSITNEDAGSNTLVESYENGVFSNTATFSGANRGRVFQDYYLGANRLATLASGGTFSNNYSCEFIVFPAVLSVTDRRKVESYLAVKYGFTLDNTGGGVVGDYVSTDDQTIWDASDNPSYHKKVIGIGRDVAEDLNQKQSHSTFDAERIYVSSLATSNANNTGAIAADVSYVLMGTNDLSNCSNALAEVEMPGTISARLQKEWKITNTNFNQTFSVDWRLSGCAVLDSSKIEELRFLVDDDGDFSNAQVYSTADGISFVSSSYGVSVKNIGTALIPMNSTKYVTLGVVKPIVTFEPASYDICQGDSVALVFSVIGSNDPMDVVLSGAGLTINLDDLEDGDTVYVAPTSTVTYQADVVRVFGCCNYGIGNYTKTIEVHDQPSIAVSADTTVCQNAQINVFASSGSGNFQYHWEHTSNMDSVQPVNIVSDSIFVVYVENEWGCLSDRDTIRVQVYPAIEVNHLPLDVYCPNEDVLIEMQANGGHGTVYHFDWSDGVSHSTSGYEARTVQVAQTTNLEVLVRDDCESDPVSINITIEIEPYSSSEFEVTPDPFLAGVEGSYHAQDGYAWVWFLDGNYTSNEEEITAIYPLPGSYEVCLVAFNSIGCADTTCRLVDVIPAKLNCPNVMTPNGDDANDLLSFTYLEFYPASKLTIWNRWGDVVYEKENYLNDWEGDDLVDGVYFYRLTQNEKVQCESFFHLIRN